jgi:hypothetical protein
MSGADTCNLAFVEPPFWGVVGVCDEHRSSDGKQAGPVP